MSQSPLPEVPQKEDVQLNRPFEVIPKLDLPVGTDTPYKKVYT